MIERIRTKALWAVIVLALLVVPLAVAGQPLVVAAGDPLRAARAAGHLRLLPAAAQHPAQLPARRAGCGSCWRAWAPSCTSTSWRTTPTAARSTGTPAR